MNGTIIFDFDSTFISVETIDTLAEIAYANDPRYEEITQYVANLTRLSMAGQCSLHEALVSRVKALQLTKQDITKTIEFLSHKITKSFVKNRKFIMENAQNILVFSGGFAEVIIPIVAKYNIPATHVYANHFEYKNDLITGVDEKRLMAHGDGKAKQLEQLSPPTPIYMIGDGSTDAITKNTGLLEKFYLFAENVLRETVVPQADKVIYSLDEFINDIKLT